MVTVDQVVPHRLWRRPADEHALVKLPFQRQVLWSWNCGEPEEKEERLVLPSRSKSMLGLAYCVYRRGRAGRIIEKGIAWMVKFSEYLRILIL